MLHVGRRPDLLLRAVERLCGEAGLAVDELGDPGVDRLRGDDAPCGDGLRLADAVAAVDGLGLLRGGPGELGEQEVGGDLVQGGRRGADIGRVCPGCRSRPPARLAR